MSARSEPAPAAVDAARVRRPLFRKYFLALFAAVVIPLLASGAIEAWFVAECEAGCCGDFVQLP